MQSESESEVEEKPKKKSKKDKKEAVKVVEESAEASEAEELSDLKDKKISHLSESGDFLGWKKTSMSLIEAKGKSTEGRKYLKCKSLLKKLWKVYKKSN